MVQHTDLIEDIEMVQNSYSTTSIHQLYIVHVFFFVVVRMRSVEIGHNFFFRGLKWVGRYWSTQRIDTIRTVLVFS